MQVPDVNAITQYPDPAAVSILHTLFPIEVCWQFPMLPHSSVGLNCHWPGILVTAALGQMLDLVERKPFKDLALQAFH